MTLADDACANMEQELTRSHRGGRSHLRRWKSVDMPREESFRERTPKAWDNVGCGV